MMLRRWRRQAALALLLAGPCLYAAESALPALPAAGAWGRFLPTPDGRRLLSSLGLDGLPEADAARLADLLVRVGLTVGEVTEAREDPARASLVRAKAEPYAERVLGAGSAADRSTLALLAALAPGHSARLAEAGELARRRAEEAGRAWSGKNDAGPVAGAEADPPSGRLFLAKAATGAACGGDCAVAGRRPPPAPAQAARPSGEPFSPARAIPLSRAAAVMERRLAAGQALSEDEYRGMSPEAFFAGDETRRMDTLLSRQAADQAQAMLEVIANGQDASTPAGRSIGRFGVGGLQVLGELKDAGDRVVMETSRGDGQAAQFLFWKKDGEVYFDYRLVPSSRRGTRFQVRKALGEQEAARRKEFLERKLRANDRGPIVWRSGERINRPEDFREWSAGLLRAADSPPVTVGLDASGYEIEDGGRGMGLKEVFERYLKPYGTDKPVAATAEPARLLYRDGPARASLGVAMVEIEPVASAVGGGRLNLAGDVFIDLPHDTDLTEDRGVVSLVPADQSINGAIRGLRLLIDRLTDPAVAEGQRFALINSLAALIREKQPAQEKGVTGGDPATATDLLWYLRHRLAKSGLLEAMREQGMGLLPNAPKWAPLEGSSDKIAFLDEALFTPTESDYAAAGFTPLPASLTRQPAWKALEARAGAKFFTGALRQDGPLAVVDGPVIVIDQRLVKGSDDPEVLIARIERELRSAARKAPVEVKGRLARLRSSVKRLLRPAVLAVALAIVPVAAHFAPAWSHQHDGKVVGHGWMAYHASHRERSGNIPMPGAREGADADADSQPQWPFGEYKASAPIDPHFVSTVKARLTPSGDWDSLEASWSARADAASIGTVEVRYRIWLDAGVFERLFNQVNGRITDVRVEDERGEPLTMISVLGDLILAHNYTGPATVSYRIELKSAINSLAASEALPENELRDFPRQWREALDPVKDGPDELKQATIERLMGRDFAYDYAKPYVRNAKSWASTAQPYLDRGERVPIICNTSSLYYYLMARYVGLPAAYVGLVSTQGGVFYHDLFGHAKVLIQVDGQWRFIETTSLMPTKSRPPRVIKIEDPTGGDGEPGWLSWGRSRSSGSNGLAAGLTQVPLPVLIAFLVLLVGSVGWFLVKAIPQIWRDLAALFYARRALQPLRRAWSAFGWRWESLPLAWTRWRTLGRRGTLERMTLPWGDVYRDHVNPERVYIAAGPGRLQPVVLFSGNRKTQIQSAGGVLTFVSRRWWSPKDRLRTFDGRVDKTVANVWGNLRLVPRLGPRQYVLHNVFNGSDLVRVDADTGKRVTVLSRVGAFLGAFEVLPLESRGGVDRFAVMRCFNNRARLRSLTVSGDKGRWDGPWRSVKFAGKNAPQLRAWPTAEGVVYELKDAKGRRTVVDSTHGALAAPVGAVEAVVAGKVFIHAQKGMTAYDPASGRRTEPVVDGVRVVSAARLADDLFVLGGLRGETMRCFFCDSDGNAIADSEVGVPAAATRQGDTVYYRWHGRNDVLHVSSRDAPARRIHLSYNPERVYSQACSRATGLAPAVFAPLDGYWDKDVESPFLAAVDEDALRQAVERDRPYLAKLGPELEAAAPYRAAMMPSWSLARLFMSVEASRAPIAPEIQARLDDLARANIGRQPWLRDVLDLVDRVYRFDIDGASAVVGHYLDIIQAAPEMLPDLRQAVLEPVILADGTRVEPLASLHGFSPQKVQALPPLTQLYLQMLHSGAESLLRREKDDAPSGPPAAALDASESLSRLIAASRKLSEDQVDAGGLPGFSQAWSSLGPGERADLSAVRGVVVNQGLSAPVWIRELIQNARDAVREARRAGRTVPPDVKLRSFLSEDGARWIVSVRDGVGMKLSRLLKAMLVPEATTKTLADEVRGFLALGGSLDQKVERLLSEFFDDGARTDAAVVAFLKEAAAAPAAEAARRISDRLSERMRKGGAGFFGIGFFTVFGGADEVRVRTGEGGRLWEVALVPVRDEAGRLTDITVRWAREYADPTGARQGTEVLRIKNVTAANAGRILIENAYAHIMAGKYAGAVSDVELGLNAQPLSDGLEVVGERGGLRSRLGRSARARWTVDELFVQDPPLQGLALVPPAVRSALLAAGWNVDFPAATPVVRTRASLLGPQRYAVPVAALALPAAYRLYREGRIWLAGTSSYADRRRTSPWDRPSLPEDARRDAAAVAGRTDDAALWQRAAADPRRWAQLMLAVCDDQERVLRQILGPELCAALDQLRAAGQPLRVGPLPAEDAPGYAATVKALHADALSRVREGRSDLDGEAAVQALERVMRRLSRFVEDPPAFVPAGTVLWEALRRCLDEDLAVPLMTAFLEAAGRGSDSAAVALFEGWLKSGGAKKELERLILGDRPRAEVQSSLDRLWKIASRGRVPQVSLRPAT